LFFVFGVINVAKKHQPLPVQQLATKIKTPNFHVQLSYYENS